MNILKEIKIARDELDKAESKLYKLGTTAGTGYFEMMCAVIVLQDIYYQKLDFAKDKIQITAEEQELKFKRQIRKYDFEIEMLSDQVNYLMGKLHKQVSPVAIFSLKREIIALVHEISSKTRFRNAYRLRAHITTEHKKNSN